MALRISRWMCVSRSCAPSALWVSVRVNRMDSGFIYLILRHASFDLPLCPPFVRFPLLCCHLPPIRGWESAALTRIVPVISSRCSPLSSVELLRPPASSSASSFTPPAPLFFASFATSPFLDCSASSCSAFGFLVFITLRIALSCDDAFAYPLLFIHCDRCHHVLNPYSLLSSTLSAAAAAACC